MSRFFTDTLQSLVPYTPGEQPQNMQYIKLNTNENPYPPSAAALAAVEAEAPRLRLYSDPESTRLCRAVAAHYGIAPGNVLCGNGSDENLMLAIRAFCDANHPLAFADVTYGFYTVWCALFGIPQHILPLEEDFTLDLTKYCGLNETIVIANPNAPTGLAHPAAAIEEVVKANPDAVVIVDEAYIDFGGESCLPLIKTYDNLLVVQTFSKSRNLAGARLGLCMGAQGLIDDLKRVKYSMNPYNVNRLSEVAGEAAINDNAYFAKTCAAIISTRSDAAMMLRARGFTVLDSRANFLFARTPKMEGGALYHRLKQKGVLVRHFDKPRIGDWLRITVGRPEEMSELYRALQEILPK